MRHLIFCGNGCFFLCLEVRKSNIFEAVKESVTTCLLYTSDAADD